MPKPKAREIELTKGLVALVDEADFADLSQHDWKAASHRPDIYLARRHELDPKTGRYRTVLMHREILGLKHSDRNTLVVHLNGNHLDNRRANLHVGTVKDVSVARNPPNVPKVSQYIGVGNSRGKWTAICRRGGRQIHLGGFDSEMQAALCRDRQARIEYGKCARLNFPDVHDYDLPDTKHVPTSEYRGVWWRDRDGRWVAVIKRNDRTIFIGSFTKDRDAALAYDMAARKLHGSKAVLNFPDVTRFRLPDKNRSSQYRGVRLAKTSGNWETRITVDGKTHYLGGFTDEIEAGRAYDRAVLELVGRDGRLNFPEEYGLEPKIGYLKR